MAGDSLQICCACANIQDIEDNKKTSFSTSQVSLHTEVQQSASGAKEDEQDSSSEDKFTAVQKQCWSRFYRTWFWDWTKTFSTTDRAEAKQWLPWSYRKEEEKASNCKWTIGGCRAFACRNKAINAQGQVWGGPSNVDKNQKLCTGSYGVARIQRTRKDTKRSLANQMAIAWKQSANVHWNCTPIKTFCT